MAKWSLEEIDWQAFDASKTDPALIRVIKAASMVEHNGYDYARYLNEVFRDDAEFCRISTEWAEEEVQHGRALRKWAELADPQFNFEQSFQRFTEGYKLPMNVDASVRGSRSGELIARCVVETGTSSYYTAIKNYTQEPVLQQICARIAADEFRHYKLFYDHLKQYLKKENLGPWKRLMIAIGRVTESEDDELAYAYYAATTTPDVAYNHERYKNAYMVEAYRFYQQQDVEKVTSMVLKAAGFRPGEKTKSVIDFLAWKAMRHQVAKATKAAA